MMASKHDHDDSTWTATASKYLGNSESVVLAMIGVALVRVAVLLLFSILFVLRGC